MELTAPVSHMSCLGVALNAVLSLSLTGQVAAHALEATAVKRGSFGQTGEAPPRDAAGWSCKAVPHGLALLFGGGEFVVHVLKTTKIQVTVVANEPKVVCRVHDAPDSDFLKEESCEVEVPPMIKGVVLRSKGRPKRVVKPELLTLEPRQTTMESHTDLLLVPFIRLPGTTFSHEVHWNNAVAMFPSSTIREMPPGEVDIVVMTDGSEHWCTMSEEDRATVGIVDNRLAVTAPATAQTPGTSAPLVTEVRRREILQAAEALTSETFAEVLKRAEAGDIEAQVLAGIALEDGKVMPRDLDRAIYWIRSAADNNHPFAQNRLGWYYESGTGVPRDPQKAVEWFARAATQGFAQAQSNLGWAYLQADGVAVNRVEGVRLLRLAAEQGNANGQFYLGLSHEFGWGVEKNAREAVGWYRKAAEQGHVRAQFGLGLAYGEGKGVRKDKDEAAKWYRKSSEQGDAIASFFYGWLHLEKPAPGMTDPLATLAAVDGLELSAAQGYPVAAFVLGEVFSYRLFPYHVRKDELEACSWYVTASNLDKQVDWKAVQPEAVAAMREDLPGRLTKIRKSLGATQFAECESRASDWLAARPPRRLAYRPESDSS